MPNKLEVTVTVKRNGEAQGKSYLLPVTKESKERKSGGQTLTHLGVPKDNPDMPDFQTIYVLPKRTK